MKYIITILILVLLFLFPNVATSNCNVTICEGPECTVVLNECSYGWQMMVFCDEGNYFYDGPESSYPGTVCGGSDIGEG